MSASANKYLRQTKWFHGTTLDAWNEICEKGVLADHNIGHELDFGYGFYLTPRKEQAERFINSLLRIRSNDNNLISELELVASTLDNPLSQIGTIIEFTFSPLEWVNSGAYNYKILNSYDDEFVDFVFHNRLINHDGSRQHDFDFIFGVMSDSNPIY